MTPLTEAQRALITPAALGATEGLAAYHAGRLPHLVRDEVLSAAYLGLCDAARLYDPARGVAFRTFLQPRVVGSIRDMLRETGPKGFKRTPVAAPDRISMSADVESTFAGDHATTIGDLIPDGSLPVGWELEAADEVAGLTRALLPESREVVRAYFTRAGATMKRIGRGVGKSESRVSQLVGASIAHLQQRFGVRHEQRD